MDSTASHDPSKIFTGCPGQLLLDGWTTVRLTGKDRSSFLHNMCTNDVRALAADSGCEAFLTDVRGKIVAHVFVLAGADEHLLIAAPGLGEQIVAHLDRYVIREDVQIENRSDSSAWTLIAGRGSGDLVARAFEPAAPVSSAPWAHGALAFEGTPMHLVSCPMPWTGGWLIGCAAEFHDVLDERLLAAGVPRADEANWRSLRLESGWPVQGVDFDESNLAQELGRNAEAIHFGKGCYLGQETIARIDALGHVNKQLATIRLPADWTGVRGAEVNAAGDVVGRLTSVGRSPTLGATLALGMVRRGFYDLGRELSVDGIRGEVIATPAVVN